MNVQIGGREYTLRFGFDALDYLDRVYEQDFHGMKFGYGLDIFLMQVNLMNITVIRHAIKAGTSTEAHKPSDKEIEEFAVEILSEENGLDEFFSTLTETLKKQPLTAAKFRKLSEKVEEEAETTTTAEENTSN